MLVTLTLAMIAGLGIPHIRDRGLRTEDRGNGKNVAGVGTGFDIEFDRRNQFVPRWEATCGL